MDFEVTVEVTPELWGVTTLNPKRGATHQLK